MATPRRRSSPTNSRRASAAPPDTVSAVMVVKDPDLDVMAQSLSSLADQTANVTEAIIVDASENPINANVEGIPTRVVSQNTSGIGGARREGLAQTSGQYIIEMDEDTVLLDRNYISDAIRELEKPGVSAAGGRAKNLGSNLEGEIIATLDRFNPTDLSTHTLVYPRSLCETEDGRVCYPMDGRGEDISVRRRLRRFGSISQMPNQAVAADYPNKRQEQGRNTLLWSLTGGVVSGLLTSAVERSVRRYGDRFIEFLRE